MHTRPHRPPHRRAAAALLGVLSVVAALLLSPPAASAADPVVVVSDGFEDGTTEGWGPRASETVAASTGLARTGTYGLAVSNRTASWQGPSLSVLGTMELGTTYTVSAWARLAAGQGSGQLRMSVERRTDGAASYDQVAGNTTVTDGAWTRLTGTYTLAHDVDFLSVYIESASGTAPFHLDDFALSYVPAKPIQTDIPRLKDVLAGHFPIGAAIQRPQTIGLQGQLLTRHFDSITPGNALKWDATHPAENTYTFAEADALVNYGTANGMAVRGHTLLWHNQTPAWVFQDAAGNPMTATPENKALLLQRLTEHITAVAGRYPEIGVWDVVNEVIDESQPDGMRRSTWFDITGLDYIRTAFTVAHQVAPNAKLFINDYNTNVPAKRDFLYDLVVRLRAEGIPIHGVGHQMHVNFEWPSIAETQAMLDTFVPLGVEQQITEMDMSIYRNSSESFPAPPADRITAQGYRYQAFFDLFRAYDDEITSVTLWGLADNDTWLDQFPVTRKDHPLLFDTELQAKPAYWGIVDPSKIEPPTEPGASCAVAYGSHSWQGGFQGTVTIKNTGTSAVDAWSLKWTFPDGQTITNLWNGSYTQSGADVTVTNTSWNGRIAAGGSTQFGFLGKWTGTNRSPAAFTLNGTVCALT